MNVRAKTIELLEESIGINICVFENSKGIFRYDTKNIKK